MQRYWLPWHSAATVALRLAVLTFIRRQRLLRAQNKSKSEWSVMTVDFSDQSVEMFADRAVHSVFNYRAVALRVAPALRVVAVQ